MSSSGIAVINSRLTLKKNLSKTSQQNKLRVKATTPSGLWKNNLLENNAGMLIDLG